MSSELAQRSAGGIRHDMVSNAVSFLQDTKVQQSTIAQRISFLQSKGLTTEEIDEALRQTGNGGGAPNSQGFQQIPYGGNYPQQMYYPAAQQPPRYDRDWRDWFIMAVISGTVGYGLIALAKKYLFPHLQPPNAEILEQDRDALTAKYDQVAEQLSALDAETKAVKQGIEEQRLAIEKSIADVEQTVNTLRDADKQRSSDMDYVKSEVESMKQSMSRMFEKTRESQQSSLADLQSELKSLKSLLVSRNNAGNGSGGQHLNATGTNATSRPYSPFASNITGDATSGSTSPKPSIPAWQLADSNASNKASTISDEPDGTSAAQAGTEHSAAVAAAGTTSS